MSGSACSTSAAKRGEIGPRGGDHELLLAGGAGPLRAGRGSASGARPREDRRNRRTPLPCRAVPGKPALARDWSRPRRRLSSSRWRCWVSVVLCCASAWASRKRRASSRASSPAGRSARSGATRAASAATSRANSSASRSMPRIRLWWSRRSVSFSSSSPILFRKTSACSGSGIGFQADAGHHRGPLGSPGRQLGLGRPGAKARRWPARPGPSRAWFPASRVFGTGRRAA